MCQYFTNKYCQKYKFYRRKEYRKSNAIHIMAIVSSTLRQSLCPFFSYCSTLYRLEVIPRCRNNLSYIFIHTYYHCQASKAKQMVQQIAEPVVKCSLPLRHYCMMLLLVLLAFGAPSSDYLAKQLTHLLVKPTEWLLQSSNRLKQSRRYAWSVSASSQSTLFKSKTFSYHMVVLE